MNFQLNDSVVVKSGVKDPDTGMDLGGWQGRIAKIEEDNLLCIDWDSLTLKNIPDSYITTCEEEGFGWNQYYTYATDVEKTEPRDTRDDVDEIIGILYEKHAWDHLGKEGEGIKEVLREIALDDEAALEAWDKHLRQVLTFPFQAEVEELQERGPLRVGDRITVEKIDSYIDDLRGIFVKVTKKKSNYVFPLADLEAMDQKGANFQPLRSYVIWFANH
ncbi:Calcium binding [Candidatus Electrothrix communis]|uniref:Calcium binding n=1 Tax=Candidatus Electrothrix communis TaxID=1859133 RepID=A0A444J7C3_9BACT|nr:Calcium binding [Candidatus Electrothrix communis]